MKKGNTMRFLKILLTLAGLGCLLAGEIMASEIKTGGHRGNGQTDAGHVQPRAVVNQWPENTLPSIQQAIDNGAELIEIDVILSKEGIPVVTHTNDLKAHLFKDDIAEDKPYVSQYNVAELKALNIGQKETKTANIPTLEEVLDLVAKHNAKAEKPVTLNIELKGRQATEDKGEHLPHSLVEGVKIALESHSQNEHALTPQQLILSSFAESVLRESADLLPELPRALLTTSLEDIDLGQPVFADEADESRYIGMDVQEIERIQHEIGLHAIHPEITTLLRPGMITGTGDKADKLRAQAEQADRFFGKMKEWQTPNGEKLAVNSWGLGESLEKNHTLYSFNAMQRAQEADVSLGLITDFVPQMVRNVKNFERRAGVEKVL